MLKPLQEHASVISISLLIIILITLLLAPNASQYVLTVMIVFGLGTAILLTIKNNWETKEDKKFTNAQFARNTAIDLLGLALIMLSAMCLGRMAGGYAGKTLGMVAGIVVGFGAALVVGKIWGIVSERLRVTA